MHRTTQLGLHQRVLTMSRGRYKARSRRSFELAVLEGAVTVRLLGSEGHPATNPQRTVTLKTVQA